MGRTAEGPYDLFNRGTRDQESRHFLLNVVVRGKS